MTGTVRDRHGGAVAPQHGGRAGHIGMVEPLLPNKAHASAQIIVENILRSEASFSSSHFRQCHDADCAIGKRKEE